MFSGSNGTPTSNLNLQQALEDDEAPIHFGELEKILCPQSSILSAHYSCPAAHIGVPKGVRNWPKALENLY